MILINEGNPCVFWQDYYGWRLGREENRSGIALLVKVHESHAGGSTAALLVDDDLNVMQRNGSGNQQGLIFVLNNRGDRWIGARERTRSEEYAISFHGMERPGGRRGSRARKRRILRALQTSGLRREVMEFTQGLLLMRGTIPEVKLKQFKQFKY